MEQRFRSADAPTLVLTGQPIHKADLVSLFAASNEVGKSDMGASGA